MPVRPKKPCNKPGCHNVTAGRYCEEHMSHAVRPRVRTNNYDSNRGNAAARGYDAKWRAYRLDYLKRNPNCKRCGAKATVVDHIIPHKGNKGLFWTTFNHQALCKSCHDSKTAREDGGFGNKIRQ
jgi:5-methylcytosine-specific restriction protein A